MDDLVEGEESRSISPVAAPLHIYSGSAMVRVDNGVVVVEREGEPRFERPIELVSAVHIHGWATITSPCIGQLISQGTPVIWRGVTGYPIGCASPMHQAGLEARRAQYAAVGTPRGFAIARAFVAAKIVNMRGLVRRRAALPGRECLAALQNHARQAQYATTLDMLLGIEGTATARYFAAWPEMISARAGDLTFETRSRRPPQDEVNALLSYAFAVLTGECLSACAAAGLDARQGFLHRPRAGRPALALDLLEPFRPLIADQAILGGLNNGQLKPEHFRAEDHAVLLTDVGRRLALDLLERRLLGSVTLEGRTEAVSWREAIGLSVCALADALRNGTSFSAIERG
jgi:CRISPR-associated endonuclease Cas1